MTNDLRLKVLKHIQDHHYGVGTFEFNGKNVYEYLLSDWDDKPNQVLVVWCLDKPVTSTIEEDSKDVIAFEAESMLDVDKARKELKKVAGKWFKT